ncbi:MAG: CocE/NonD family hydrolase [Thermoleophilia bacterium]
MRDVEVRTDFPRAIEVRGPVWIPLPDGTRLHARIWLPTDADEQPVPAVIEYGPYRLSDGTVGSDEQQMRWFAGHGYAGMRIDIRGTGESSGLCTDEYTRQETLDGVEAIAWIAEQPWCSGAVGIIGYSWTGFNGLQIAALRPPALKAVVTGYSTDDRYTDDVHYRGGLIDAMDMLHWSVCMQGWQARPPVPAIYGDGWREAWRERLELDPWITHWMSHQHRDDYWRRGSACEDFDQIDVPVMCIAGWADGYTDSAFRVLVGARGPRKAVIGPWGHVDPIHGPPAPQVGILSEATRFWDRWLRGIDSGIDDDPMLVAYEQDPVRPAAIISERPGRWISEDTWPSPRLVDRAFILGDGTLASGMTDETVVTVASTQTVGLDGGVWCADGRSADLAIDQRREEAFSACFTSEPFDEDFAILGHAVAHLALTADRPVAMVSLRLSEVLTDGSSLLVTRAQLNLCHRNGNHAPTAVVPGEEMQIRLPLDSMAHRFRAGSRLRVAISPCYWPWAWPSPEPVTLGIRTGASSIVLPTRPARVEDAVMRELDPPAEPAAVPIEMLRSGSGGARTVTYNQGTGRTDLVFDWDIGGAWKFENGLIWEDSSVTTLSITDGDPLSAEVVVENTSLYEDGDRTVEIVCRGAMSCTADDFLVTSQLDVRENGRRMFSRAWDCRFPRDHM